MIVISYKRLKYILLIVITLVAIMLIINNSTALIKLFYPLKYKEQVFNYSEKYGIDPYLVMSVMKAESGFKKNAISPKGAKGLMQVTNATGKWAADKLKIQDFTEEMLYDPSVNIQIGVWYLSVLKNEFKSDIKLMIAAYNSGNGKVREWLKNNEYSKNGKSLDVIPYTETRNFSAKVFNDYRIYVKLYKK